MEMVDHRYLGALQCMDRATGAPLNRYLTIEANDVSFFRNRSGQYVIADAPGLKHYSDEFNTPPATPAVGSIAVNVEVRDPLNQYLPRLLQIALPRDADPANSDQPDSLFQPMQVKLYPAPNAALQINWSTIRVSVVSDEGGQDQAVAGALLRVKRNSDDKVLSSGLTDQRGESLIIVPGIPITQFAEEEDPAPGGRGRGGGGSGRDINDAPVVVTEMAATLEVSVSANQTWPVNPDELELNHESNLRVSESLTLRTGRMEKLTIRLTS